MLHVQMGMMFIGHAYTAVQLDIGIGVGDRCQIG